MAVRNFWIDAEIDGRETTLSGGPRSRDGGFQMTIKIRNNGGIETALKVYGWADDEGKLRIDIDEGDLPYTRREGPGVGIIRIEAKR